MAGSPKSQTVSNEPPKYLRPYLSDIAGQAQNVYQSQTGFAPEQEQAFGLQTQRALAGSPLNQAAQNQNLATVRGDYLYGGPGFDAAYQAASNRIIPQVNSAFARSGRTGSGLAQTAMTGALGDAFASQYGQERANQMQAAAMSPALANQDYFDIGMLQDVGAQRQAFPWQQLQNYSSIVNPQAAMGGTQTSPLYQNRAAGALGGGLAAYGAGLGPWGALGGAVLGGLL